MNLLTLTLKDLRRRRARSALTVAGVALAAATLFSLLSFNHGDRQSLQKEMSDSGIHMFVSTEGNFSNARRARHLSSNRRIAALLCIAVTRRGESEFSHTTSIHKPEASAKDPPSLTLQACVFSVP